MNADEVIAAYIHDVAVRLPRRQRNDVAFELGALLHEQLQDRADAEGRLADAAMATALVRAFGDPRTVAARYQPALTVIDPVDGRGFMRATLIGLALLWPLGLLDALQKSNEAGTGLLTALGHWWAGTVVASLWWPGLLVVGFALAAWARRRWPQKASTWKPLAPGRIAAGRVTLALGVVGIVCGIGVLLDPRWLLDLAWHGRAAPAAYQALTYTEAFVHRQGPWLLALLLLNIPLLATVIARGRWSPTLRRLEMLLALATCAVLAWTVLDGPVFMAQASDQVFKGCVTLVIAFSLASTAVRVYRSVRPAPARLPHG
jgi:hypothetical protein